MYQAIQNNPTLKSQKVAQQIALYRKEKSKSALLPRLDFSVSLFDSDNNNSDLTEYKLLLTQSVFNGALWSNFEQVELDILVAQWDYLNTLENLFITLSSIYTDALIAKSELDLSQLNVELSLKNHHIAKKAYELGNKSYLEWVKSQADLVESKADVMNKQDSYQNNLDHLNRYLNNNSQTKEVVEYSLSEFIDKSIEGIDNHQFAHLNTELKSFMYRVRSARKSIEAAEWEYWPNVVFTIEAARRESGSEFVDNPVVSEELKFGLQLNWNLFQGWGTDASVNEVTANQNQLKYQLEQRIQDLENEIQQLNSALKQSQRQIKSLETIKEVRQSALEVAQRSWELGVIGFSEVLTERLELFKTKQLLSQEQHNYNLNSLKIYKFLGKINL